MGDETDDFGGKLRDRVVVVTGASGFIGGRLVERLAALGARLRLSCRSEADPALRSVADEVVLGDLRDAELWEQILPGSDFVFHLAAQTSARASERDPNADFSVNLEVMRRLLATCERRGLKPKILFAGSITQCGAPAKLPLDGTEPDRPLSFYDLHKLAAEQVLEFFSRRGALTGATLRLPSVYGLGPRERSADCGVLNRMMRSALKDARLEIYGAVDRLRDYLHVEDVVLAFLMTATAMDRCNGRHFVIGSGERYSVADAVRLVALATERETGRRTAIVHVDPPADEPEIAKAGFLVDASSFRTATSWAPHWKLADGIDATVRELARQLRGA